jgi:hypothetical protein
MTAHTLRLNVAILSCRYGGGHQRVAEVLVDELRQRSPGCRVAIYDYIESCIGHGANLAFTSLYFGSVRWTPWLYHWFYHATSAIPPHSPVQRAINRLGKRRLAVFLRTQRPDLVVCTYCLPVGGMSELKREGRTDVPCATVVTDHAIHSQWIHPGIDLYLVSSEHVRDGIRFVIGHELTKVFRQEFPGLTDESRPYTRADLSRAWGLLHNCLQQTAITLAQAFKPGVTGEQLFEDYRSKVENSFTLYRELHALLQKVSAAEGSSGILLKHSLVRHLEHFREETMHFLMYKDWGQFGRYVDDVKRAFEEMEEFESVLHEFSQYLRTLIHHVGMREALRGVQVHPGEAAKE